jgi:WD40 repeat protein
MKPVNEKNFNCRCLITLLLILVALALLPAGAQARGEAQSGGWQLPGVGNAVAFSPDGQMVLAGNQLRRTADGQLIRTFNLRHGSEVNAAAFSPDGQYAAIAVQASDLNLNFFRVSDGFRIAPSGAHHNGTTTANFSPDGQLVATGGRDGTVKLWHVPDFTLVNTFLGGPGYGARVFSVLFSSDGQYLAVGGQGGVLILRASNGETVRVLADSLDTAQSLALTRDGTTLAAGFFTTHQTGVFSLKLWRFSDGALLKTIAASDQPINSVAFQPDAKVLASGGGDDTFSGVIRFFRVRDSAQLGYFPQDPNNGYSYVTSVAYSPNGQFIAYARADRFVVVTRNPFLMGRTGDSGVEEEESQIEVTSLAPQY